MKKIFIILGFLLAINPLTAQKSLLQSGPMIGRINKIDVKLWAQTKKTASVQFAYWEAGKTGTKQFSDKVKTKKSDGYTAHILIDGLKPGTTYNYQLYINGKKISFSYPTQFKTQEVWAYHHAPSDFKFAFGSGAYINDPVFDRAGRPYGGQYEIYQNIAYKKPDFMI